VQPRRYNDLTPRTSFVIVTSLVTGTQRILKLAPDGKLYILFRVDQKSVQYWPAGDGVTALLQKHNPSVIPVDFYRDSRLAEVYLEKESLVGYLLMEPVGLMLAAVIADAELGVH